MGRRKAKWWNKKAKPSHVIGAITFLIVFVAFIAIRSKPRPNVIIIVVDSLRRDFLGSYGFKGNISPHIDKFSKQSVLYENCVAPSPWTGPSVASLFTGLYPHSHGALGRLKKSRTVSNIPMRDLLPEEADTLAEVLKKAGYFTYGISGNDWVAPQFGFHQGFDVLEEHAESRFKSFGIWYMIERLLPKLSQKKPFFLYLHFMDLHAPYDSDRDYFNELKKSPSLGVNAYITEDTLTLAEKQLKTMNFELAHILKHQSNNWKAVYASAVKKFDQKFSVLLDLFEEKNLLDNSVVILTSDHGEAFFENGAWYHGKDLHWNQINVPFLIRLPGEKRGGTRIEKAISLVDVMPTILDLAKIPSGELKMHGESLISNLRLHLMGEINPRKVISESAYKKPNIHAVQKGKWKYIKDRDINKKMLYDIQVDPHEQKTLVSEKPEIVRGLEKDLDWHLERSKKEALPSKMGKISNEKIEELKALGYL